MPPPSGSDAGTPPPSGVPGNLAPDGGQTITTPSVTMTCSAIASATSYEFAIEFESSGGYAPYYTYSGSTPSRTFYPQIQGIGYRWRVRAKVNGVFGDWSSYATFQYK